MAERNTHVPEDRRMRFRIGINLGDVLIQDDDILGDGVNVAARLEGIAEPEPAAWSPRRSKSRDCRSSPFSASGQRCTFPPIPHPARRVK